MAKREVTDEEILLRMAQLGNTALAELELRGLDVRGDTPQETARKLKRLKRKLRSGEVISIHRPSEPE
jgi:hypothetical protein